MGVPWSIGGIFERAKWPRATRLSMTTFPGEPKRIAAFRMELAAAIPRFPNNGASLRALQQKSLGELLIDFFNWRIRYVGVRPRTVVIDPLASASADWGTRQGIIVPFLEKVTRGDDLTPHLSLQPHTRGFSPNSGVRRATVEQRWVDKDNSVVLVDHDMKVAAASDWVIDIGPGAGDEGGRIVASGPPATVAACQTSRTAPYPDHALGGGLVGTAS